MDSKKNSRDVAALENIRPQILAPNFVSSDVLNGRPPLGVQEDFVSHPIRDGLLADSGPVEKLSDALSKGCLASSEGDGALKSGNVVSLHGRSLTRILVGVNKNSCFAEDKEVCNVLDMTTTKRKERQPRQPKAPSKARAEIGPDGLTMPQRLERLMTDRGVGQTELARMCSQFYAAYYPNVDSAVQQQHIFNILHKQSDSWVLPLVAHVFDVNTLWLQFGIGPQARIKN